MSLGWKDAGSTLTTAAVVTLAIAVVRGWTSFLTVRWAISGILILGIGACAVGAASGGNLPMIYSITFGVLVAASIITALLGLAFNNKAYVVVLAAIIALMWFVSTMRHALA